MLLFILVTLILPAVLDGCCLPGQFAGIQYTTEKGEAATFTVDYSGMSKKIMFRPFMNKNADYEYIIRDYNSGYEYKQMKDKTCVKVALDPPVYLKCIPKTATNLKTLDMGPKIGGINVHAWRFMHGAQNMTVAAHMAQCLPVVIRIQMFGEISTLIYTNVTTSKLDLGDMNQDTNHCQDEYIG